MRFTMPTNIVEPIMEMYERARPQLEAEDKARRDKRAAYMRAWRAKKKLP